MDQVTRVIHRTIMLMIVNKGSLAVMNKVSEVTEDEEWSSDIDPDEEN